MGVAHNVAIGRKHWMLSEAWNSGLPPQSLISSIIPILVIILKLVQCSLFVLLKYTRKIQRDKKGRSRIMIQQTATTSTMRSGGSSNSRSRGVDDVESDSHHSENLCEC